MDGGAEFESSNLTSETMLPTMMFHVFGSRIYFLSSCRDWGNEVTRKNKGNHKVSKVWIPKEHNTHQPFAKALFPPPHNILIVM